jgi:hypothetical protein
MQIKIEKKEEECDRKTYCKREREKRLVERDGADRAVYHLVKSIDIYHAKFTMVKRNHLYLI